MLCCLVLVSIRVPGLEPDIMLLSESAKNQTPFSGTWFCRCIMLCRYNHKQTENRENDPFEGMILECKHA